MFDLCLDRSAGGIPGFLCFPPRYTSTAMVLVEGQKVQSSYVAPVITQDFLQRVQTLSAKVQESPSLLRPMVHQLAIVKPEEEGKIVGEIQQNMLVVPIITSMTQAASTPSGKVKKPSANN